VAHVTMRADKSRVLRATYHTRPGAADNGQRRVTFDQRFRRICSIDVRAQMQRDRDLVECPDTSSPDDRLQQRRDDANAAGIAQLTKGTSARSDIGRYGKWI